MKTIQIKIQNAFEKRKKPKNITNSNELSADEYDDLNGFVSIHPDAFTCDHLENHYEAIFWLSPESFYYYLPSILSTSIRENEPNISINHSIIGMLDRNPDTFTWDDFFIERWTLLNIKEYEAVQEWLIWIASFDNSSFNDDSLSRAFDTLELLKSKKLVK